MAIRTTDQSKARGTAGKVMFKTRYASWLLGEVGEFARWSPGSDGWAPVELA